MMTPFSARGSLALLVVISGPSGAGKSTLIQHFLARHPDFAKSLSDTTRAPRAGEREGVDYRYIEEAEFQHRIDGDAFLEHALVFGKFRYGTPRAFIEDSIAAGRSVIKDIDVQGAAAIRERFPAAVLVFVVPPRREDIEARLRSRNTESDADIALRLEASRREIDAWTRFDYLLVNRDLDQAVEDLAVIVRSERMRVARSLGH